MRNAIFVIVAVLFLSGCPAQPPKDDAAVSQQDTDGNTASDSAQTGKLDGTNQTEGSSFVAGDEPYRKDAINDATSPLSQQTIYFDFNADTIKEEYRDLITWHGRYLASNPDMKVRLEGHTDERGTREYNVALGDRRAQAVSRMMMFQGATNKQIDVVSFGEEKPVALDHDEASWSQNRRVQLVYEAM